jgi:sugar (pentulose or hexulose) kinase
VACLLRENIELMERNGVTVTHVRSLGGGSKSRLWTQIKAGVTGKPIALMEEDEATSLGAAILGSVAIGWYASVKQACAKAVRVKEEVRPDPRLVETYDAVYRRIQSLRSGLVR